MDLKAILDQRKEFQQYLYSRGFCITSRELPTDLYPFYGQWQHNRMGKFNLYTHPDKKVTIFSGMGCFYFLVGHAYNPFSMEEREEYLLKDFCSCGNWDVTNQWTGIYCVGYVEDDQVCFTTDAAGQQMVYYGIVKDSIYITSHARLVEDFEPIVQDEYISKLTKYYFFHAFGLVLPGDLSPYKELKRAQCNFTSCLTIKGDISHKRFWPKVKIKESDADTTIREIGEIIHCNMELIARKWPPKRAAISVTGGMDSKTTLACSKGLYDEFSYFSYDSLPDEKVDCDAAHILCQALGLEHRQYLIPYTDDKINNIEVWDEILRYNCGCIGSCNRNDVRKRAFFTQKNDFDVEVKSWVDEIGRARYHKRYAKKNFPKRLTPRYITSIYKPFIWQRLLYWQTRKVFKDYIENYYEDGVFNLVPWWDLVYWEYEWGAAEGAFLTGDHLTPYDITIPFNNRIVLEKMLSIPLQMRIDDEIQKRIIHEFNTDIEKTGINVQDVSHTDKRALMEKVYLEINTRLPF